VKGLLLQDYPTERPHEIPHPQLEDVIRSTTFDYLDGRIEGEVPNGETSRDGNPYLWFKHGDKSILSHRFVSAVTLGKWVPRECNIDHINHDPSDNRPINLRITTPRDNSGNRREALLSELADIQTIHLRLSDAATAPKSEIVPEAEPPIESIEEGHGWERSQRQESSGSPKYTGETKPGNSSGTYYGTTFASWHWYPEGIVPDPSDYVGDA